MTQPVCTTCEEEKLNHFSKFYKNRQLKYCKKCDQPIFFLSQLSHHRRHKYFLISKPLYCFKSLCSGNIKDQICPFCKTAFSTKKSYICITYLTFVRETKWARFLPGERENSAKVSVFSILLA